MDHNPNGSHFSQNYLFILEKSDPNIFIAIIKLKTYRWHTEWETKASLLSPNLTEEQRLGRVLKEDKPGSQD